MVLGDEVRAVLVLRFFAVALLLAHGAAAPQGTVPLHTRLIRKQVDGGAIAVPRDHLHRAGCSASPEEGKRCCPTDALESCRPHAAAFV
jgi:hypothetical protein